MYNFLLLKKTKKNLIPSIPILVCSIGLFIGSCRDAIDLVPTKDQLEGVSIQAKVVKGNPSIAYAIVERIFTYSGESRKTLPIESVSIIDEAGHEFFLSKNNTVSDYIGFIDGQSVLQVNYQERYACRVILSNGNIYVSNFENILPVPTIESLEVEVIEKNIINILDRFELAKFARFKVNTPIVRESSATKSKLRWIIYRSYRLGNSGNGHGNNCVFTDLADFSHVAVVDGNRVDGDFLKGFSVFDEYIDFSFGFTYYLTVSQESLTDEAFQYYSQLENLTQRVGNQFEETPGVIQSNFSNINDPSERVYGFFYATENSTGRIRVCPKDLGFQPDQGGNINFCIGGSIPDFWEDCD